MSESRERSGRLERFGERDGGDGRRESESGALHFREGKE